MRNRDPFGEVLTELRGLIRNAAFAEGAPLFVSDLSVRLGVSQTPVREALAYLAGEGLIDGRQGQVRGYQMWRAEPDTLADLLRLHQAQVMIALAQSSPPCTSREGLGASSETEPPALADQAEALFARWVAGGGAEPLRRAHRLCADRLRPMRLREGRLLAGVEDELAGLAAAVAGTERAAAVRAYHRRRMAIVGRLAGAMR